MVWFVESTICALKEFAEWEETEFHAAIILKGISRQASTGYTTSCSNRRVCSQAEARLYTLGRKGKKCLRGRDFHCSGSDIRLQCRLFTINACLWEWHQALHVDSLWANHHDHLQWLQRCGSFILHIRWCEFHICSIYVLQFRIHYHSHLSVVLTPYAHSLCKLLHYFQAWVLARISPRGWVPCGEAGTVAEGRSYCIPIIFVSRCFWSGLLNISLLRQLIIT